MTLLKQQPSGAVVSTTAPAAGLTRKLLTASPWWLMILPAVVLLVVLMISPVVQSLLASFERTELGEAPTFVGLDNYRQFLSDDLAWTAIRTTVVFAGAATALEVVAAWGLALLLWDLFAKVGNVVRVLFAIPMMLSPVVVGVVWRVILTPGYGWVPYIFGDKDLDLLGRPELALWTMIVVDAWQWTPFLFIVFAAGLSSVSEELIEAARVDGSSYWGIIRSIVWPMTLPITMVGILFRLIDELKVFDLPYNLTLGGPGTVTQTFSMYTYKQAFVNFDNGYASTLAVVATLAAGAVAAVLVVVMRRAEQRTL